MSDAPSSPPIVPLDAHMAALRASLPADTFSSAEAALERLPDTVTAAVRIVELAGISGSALKRDTVIAMVEKLYADVAGAGKDGPIYALFAFAVSHQTPRLISSLVDVGNHGLKVGRWLRVLQCCCPWFCKGTRAVAKLLPRA